MNKIILCKNCKHRPKNVVEYTRFPEKASILQFPNNICPLQCEYNNEYNKWIGYDFYCAKGELDKDAVCKNCEYFHTEYYDYSDIRIATKNFCYAEREKEEVHPFLQACQSFKRRREK